MTIGMRDQEIAKLQRELEAARAALAACEVKVTELQGQVGALEKAHETDESTIKKLKESLAKLDKKLAEELEKEEALSRSLEKDEKELAEDKKAFVSKDAEIADLKRQLEELRRLLNDVETAKRLVDLLLADVQKQYADLRAEHAPCSGIIASLREQLEAPKAPPRICGVGMTLQAVEGREALCVSALIPGLPAALCGRIVLGDAILAVDKTSVIGYNIDAVVKLIKGNEGAPVSLEFVTAEQEYYEITLTRAGK